MLKINQTVIILGSSRSRGDTFKIAKYLQDKGDLDLIDLNNYNISYYDYNHENRIDDFLPLIRQLIEQYNTFIFATPVYWYTMSGIMKVFLDRFSDLLTIEKEMGRRLRGKNMALMSCSNEDDLTKEFNIPFIKSAEYLGMNWVGQVHGWIEQESLSIEVQNRLNEFLKLCT